MNTKILIPVSKIQIQSQNRLYIETEQLKHGIYIECISKIKKNKENCRKLTKTQHSDFTSSSLGSLLSPYLLSRGWEMS